MRLASIKVEDFVFDDIKGRQFYAQVTGREDRRLQFRPLCAGVGWWSATARDVVGHWRKTGRLASATQAS